MDFKTGNPSDDKAEMYSRQLHAYALSLENPAKDALKLSPVTCLGLLYFTPDKCHYVGNDRQVLGGQRTWIEIKRNDNSFHAFLRERVSLLDSPLPSPDPDKCDWCRYRSKLLTVQSSSTELKNKDLITLSLPICPQCGGPMRSCKGKYGDFWGCLNYPDCRGTRQIAQRRKSTIE